MTHPSIDPQIPSTGYMRLEQIVGNRKKGIPPILPICRSSFLNRVKLGIYPQPIRLTERTVAWKAESIRELIQSLENQRT